MGASSSVVSPSRLNTPKMNIWEIVRSKVEMVAERNANGRQLDSPKLSQVQLSKLKRKERILEELRMHPVQLEVCTTSSMIVSWEFMYPGTETATTYVLQAKSNVDCHLWASLDLSPDIKVEFELLNLAWTSMPNSVLDIEKNCCYIGGLTPNIQMQFRVRARHHVGWAMWSSLDPKTYKCLAQEVAGPKIVAERDNNFAVNVKLTMPTCFGQLLAFKLYGRRLSVSQALENYSMAKSNEEYLLYTGRDENVLVGSPWETVSSGEFLRQTRSIKDVPLQPNTKYSFRMECETGLNKSDKRYDSHFSSFSTVFHTDISVPTRPHPLVVKSVTETNVHVEWAAPVSDGGSIIFMFKILAIIQDDHSALKEVEFYSGSDFECIFGIPNQPGVRNENAIHLSESKVYHLRLVAINENGSSLPSESVSVSLQPEPDDQPVYDFMQLEMDTNCSTRSLLASPDAFVDLPIGWREYWDPKSEEFFYYNFLTGENQWSHPETVVLEDITDIEWRLFRKKRFRFLECLRGKKSSEVVRLNIRRNFLVEDSSREIKNMTINSLMTQRLSISFDGEAGIDSGGLSKDWYIEFSSKLLQPDYGLFSESCGCYFIDPRSSLIDNVDKYFFAFGRLIGKILRDQQLINAPFCDGIFKQIMGLNPDIDDLRQVDPLYAKSLEWMLANDVTDVIDETFSITVEEFGIRKQVELMNHGTHVQVTEQNKAKYVKALVKWRFLDSVKEQLNWLLRGIWQLVSLEHIEMFDVDQLKLLVNGKPYISISEWKNGCVNYTGGFTETSPEILMFWDFVENIPTEDRAKILRFTTGCDKLPLDGFPPFLPFTITKSVDASNSFPTAHTCFNQLVLPSYASIEILKQKMLDACELGVGFEMS